MVRFLLLSCGASVRELEGELDVAMSRDMDRTVALLSVVSPMVVRFLLLSCGASVRELEGELDVAMSRDMDRTVALLSVVRNPTLPAVRPSFGWVFCRLAQSYI